MDVSTKERWEPWKLANQAADMWADQTYHKDFFEYAKARLVVPGDSWGDVPNLRRALDDCGGGFLLDSFYHGSVYEALSAVYPDKAFLRCKLEPVTSDHWKDRQNVRALLDYSGKLLGVTSFKDWYGIRKVDFVRVAGHNPLTRHFNGSLHAALKFGYPEHEWLPWCRATVPKSFWTKPENLREFASWLGRELAVSRLEDWYHVTKTQVAAKWPRVLARGNGNHIGSRRRDTALAELLSIAYPEHTWLPWRFVSGVSMNHWDSIDNQRQFFDWFLRETEPDSSLLRWYEIPYARVIEHGGLGLLANKYGASLPRALRSVYPNHKWLEWKFSTGVSKAFWEEKANQIAYMDWLYADLGLSSFEDWYRIRAEDLKARAGAGLLKHHGYKMSQLLPSIYSSHQWENWRFNSSDPGAESENPPAS